MARDLSKTEISNREDGEFEATVIRIITGLEKSLEDFGEALNPEIKGLKNCWKQRMQ